MPPVPGRDRCVSPIALDQPEHGGSSGPACTSVEELGRNLAGFVDALEVPRSLVLLGHSLGGAVAQWYVGRRPDDIVALGLVSTLPQFTVDAPTLARWKADGLAYPRERLDAIVHPDASFTVRAQAMAARAETTLAALHGDLDAIASWSNPDWRTIPLPTLVVSADADSPAVLAAAHDWAEGLPRGAFARIPRAGHMMPIEQPESTARAIVDWLDVALDGAAP